MKKLETRFGLEPKRSAAAELLEFSAMGMVSMNCTSPVATTSMQGVRTRPTSPGSNFTTYSLPRAGDQLDAPDPAVQDVIQAKPKGGRRGAGGGGGGGCAAMGAAIRQLLNCSYSPAFFQHCHQHSRVELGHELDDSPILAGHNNDKNVHGDHSSSTGMETGGAAGGEDLRLRTEMKSVLRHLEVRWQLFNEALSKFGDLDAMLAVCADSKGRWRCYKGGTAKDAQLVDVLQSLIDRKLSMDVFINKVTQLLPSGAMGLTLDCSYGTSSWGQQLQQPLHEDSGVAAIQAQVPALEEVLQDFKTSQQIGISDDDVQRIRSSSKPRCVLEEDCYTLYDQKGNVVEEGRQVVIWEQQNSIWYIHGCVSYPSTTL